MNIKSIVWLPMTSPRNKFDYDHVLGLTPFGRFVIAQKIVNGIQTFVRMESPCVDDFKGAYPTLEAAKNSAQTWFDHTIGKCIKAA